MLGSWDPEEGLRKSGRFKPYVLIMQPHGLMRQPKKDMEQNLNKSEAVTHFYLVSTRLMRQI